MPSRAADRIQPETLGEHLRDGRPGRRRRSARRPTTRCRRPGFNLEQHLQDIERTHVERALQPGRRVQVRAADLLGLSFRQFRYLVKKYNLRAADSALTSAWQLDSDSDCQGAEPAPDDRALVQRLCEVAADDHVKIC